MAFGGQKYLTLKMRLDLLLLTTTVVAHSWVEWLSVVIDGIPVGQPGFPRGNGKLLSLVNSSY